jgi:hypothetical protein
MRYHLPLTLTLLALCACALQPSMQPPASSSDQAVTPAAVKSGRLFVSEPAEGSVYLYDIPSLHLVTILQTFTHPEGECADDVGDVWVADAGANEVDKLDYAGRIVGRIRDKIGTPYSCAWEKSTGNLAVTSSGQKGKAGFVLLYRQAAGSPLRITNPAQASYDFAGYDASGDIYFDGATAQHDFVLSEESPNEHTAHTIAISGAKIVTPGFVQWDSRSQVLDVGDQNCANANTTCVYQLQVTGRTANVVNQIDLKTYQGSKVCDVIQAVVFSDDIYGSDDESCDSAPSATYEWHNPSGGVPKRYLTKGVSAPFGATVATESDSSAAPAAYSHHLTFRYVGKPQTFKVPSKITELHVVAIGGRGAGPTASYGGRVSADIPVKSGESLTIRVGGNAAGTAGGYNGGGKGGYYGYANNKVNGYGGGGASDIRQSGDSLDNRILVTGGGGGQGGLDDVGGSSDHGLGGKGGRLTGGTGDAGYPVVESPNCSGYPSCGGKGGSQQAGGRGGLGGVGPCAESRGFRGSLSLGGPGAKMHTSGSYACGGLGGGGGGGYYGGGGGGQGAGSDTISKSAGGGGGGGGGSSYVEPSGTNVYFWQGWRQNDYGLVVISW